MSGLRSVLLLCWRDTGHPQGGGSETYLQRIGAQLAASGVAVTLRTARYPGAPRREVIDGVRISRAGGRYSVYVWALLAMAAARLGMGPLRRVRPDVVVDTQNGLPFLARLVYGRRVAVFVHHCHREQWPVAGPVLGRLGWFVESRLSPRVHRRNQYVTVSLPSARDLVGLGVANDRIALVRNGLDEAPEVSLRGPRAGTPARVGVVPAGAAQADRGRVGRRGAVAAVDTRAASRHRRRRVVVAALGRARCAGWASATR